MQQLVKVDLRVMVQVVPPQDVISRDNVSVKVNAVLYFRIVDPERAIIKVGDYMAATSQLAQTTLRSVLGKHELDEMLAERDRLNADIQESLDRQTDVWGIKVTAVEIKDIDLNETMVRAIAKQAEAERLRRAKVINAMGEQQAAEKLVEAGRISPRSRRRCSYAISLRCTTSLANGPRPWSFRSRWICSTTSACGQDRGILARFVARRWSKSVRCDYRGRHSHLVTEPSMAISRRSRSPEKASCRHRRTRWLP